MTALERSRQLLLGHYRRKIARLSRALELLRLEYDWSLLEEPSRRKRPRSTIEAKIKVLLPELQESLARLHDLTDYREESTATGRRAAWYDLNDYRTAA